MLRLVSNRTKAGKLLFSCSSKRSCRSQEDVFQSAAAGFGTIRQEEVCKDKLDSVGCCLCIFRCYCEYFFFTFCVFDGFQASRVTFVLQ